MFLLADYIAPLTAFCIVLSLSRLRQKAYLQARWMFGGYMVLYAGFHFLFIWPPGLGLMLSLVATGIMLWLTLSFAALAMACD